MRAVLDSFGESIKPYLKGCPFFGDIDVLIEADVSKFPSIFPSGMYKFDVKIAKGNNSKLINWIVEIEIVSNIKTSF